MPMRPFSSIMASPSSSPNISTASGPSAAVLFHQSQFKLLLEDVGERYMLAMRHIIYVLDEIEDIPGSSISKSDMLDSFRKA